jgi:hypothetical protein
MILNREELRSKETNTSTSIYLLLQVKNSNPIWRREEVTNNFLGSNPRVRDPYERRNVYVGPSTIPGAGEGLFAKRDMEERELVAYLVYG